MARMPGATWRPVPNCTKGGQYAVDGVVLHIMAGTLDGSDSWFRNPKSQASSHFGVGKDGRIYQWVDTADRAWAQSSGNRRWLSIEHEGQSGDALTAKQLAATARIVAWMHATHGVKLQATDSPTGRGIGWHGMGGSAWGGHTACPGTPIKNQRTAIIQLAKGDTTTEEDPMAGMTKADVYDAVWATDKMPPAKGAETKDNPTWQPQSILRDVAERVRAIQVAEAGQTAAITALAALVGTGVDTAAVIAAVEKAIADAVIKVDVNVTGPAAPTS